jgi:hypothetical protein
MSKQSSGYATRASGSTTVGFFPSRRKRGGPISRETTSEWCARLEKEAKIPHVRGR